MVWGYLKAFSRLRDTWTSQLIVYEICSEVFYGARERIHVNLRLLAIRYSVNTCQTLDTVSGSLNFEVSALSLRGLTAYGAPLP